jgi:hypothetical protein
MLVCAVVVLLAAMIVSVSDGLRSVCPASTS